jgi:S-adenosylhomocysteine hydrolase
LFFFAAVTGKGTTSSRADQGRPNSRGFSRRGQHRDKRVAKQKVESMEIKIDRLTPKQDERAAGRSEGT